MSATMRRVGSSSDSLAKPDTVNARRLAASSASRQFPDTSKPSDSRYRTASAGDSGERRATATG